MATPPIHIWVPGLREGSGGIQAFSRVFVRTVAEGYPGNQVTVLVRNDLPGQDDSLRALPNLTLHSSAAWRGRSRALAFSIQGLRLALKERPACIISTHLHFLPVMQLTRALTGARILSMLHGIDVWYLRGWLRRRAVHAADHLMAVSRHTRDITLRRFDLPPERVSIVPNTFDGQRFSPGAKPAHLLRRHALKPEQPVLLAVSRLGFGDRLKGHRQVLLALHRLRDQLPDVVFMIAGDGPDTSSLSEMARGLGLENRVLFAGAVSDDDLPDYYRLCDVFVLPSQMEGFGIVFLEALASGKPVIAGNRDGSVDPLDDGRLGQLVDPCSANDLAAAIADQISSLDSTPPDQPAALHSAVTALFGPQRVTEIMVSTLRPWVQAENIGQTSTQQPPPARALAKPTTKAFRLVVITEFTSPFQIELFNAIARLGECFLEVIYMTDRDATRSWSRPALTHCAWMLNQGRDQTTEAWTAVREADLVICNTYLFRFALPALWRRALLGRPWLFWGERPGSLRTGAAGRWLRRLLLQPLHQHAIPIWGMGAFGVQGYQREFGKQRRHHNLSYASDLGRFQALPLPCPSGPRPFLFAGRFTRRKGADLIAAAFARIATRHTHARLILAGEGELEASMRQTLSNCRQQVEWLGFQSWEQLPAAFGKAAILCQPSRYDGWGLSLVQGLASGMPAIGTTQTGSALDLLADGSAGWLIPPNNLTALVEAMENALFLEDGAFAHKQMAARAASAPHDVTTAAPRFLALCRQALEDWPSVHPGWSPLPGSA